MFKVKVFEAAQADELQDAVNAWLREHATVDIVSVTQSESAIADSDGDICGNTTYTILYKAD